MNNRLINPSVLLAEDDPSTLRDIAQKFTLSTGLGVIPANTLGRAAQYLKNSINGRHPVASVFADHHFLEDAPDYKLSNGLDLLKMAQQFKPKANLYLYTVNASDEELISKAKIAIGSESRVFSKGEERSQKQQPWFCVWREWLLEALRTDSSVVRTLKENKIDPLDALQRIQMDDSDMIDKIKLIFDARRYTYMDFMGIEGQLAGLKFNRPIEVVCMRNQDGSYTARALGLGVLKESIEQLDAWEAQWTLADYIVEQYLDLRSTGEDSLGPFARLVWMNLQQVIGEQICDEIDSSHK